MIYQPWSEDDHLAMMKTCNISKSILSITSPGTHLVPGDDELARKVSRDCNKFAADLVKRRPEQFGFWASLPLPDVKGSLDELSFALDELGAEGVCVETNHHGRYLGHPSFDPVFAELNRRKTIIFVHPTCPCMVTETGCQKIVPLPQYPIPMFEFMFDTARAVINLFLSGTVFRYPNITYIIPHAGGALPPIIQRFSIIPGLLGLDVEEVNPESVKAALKRQFYFDLAGFPFPDQIHGLLPYISTSQLLYGSDYPYTPLKGVVTLVHQMDDALPGVFPKEEDREAIYVLNARRLLKPSSEGFRK